MKTQEQMDREAAEKYVFEDKGALFSNNNDEAANGVQAFLAGIAHERAKTAKVREALEFYADKKNWGTYPEDESSGKNALLLTADSEHYSDVWVGHRARQALALLDRKDSK